MGCPVLEQSGTAIWCCWHAYSGMLQDGRDFSLRVGTRFRLHQPRDVSLLPRMRSNVVHVRVNFKQMFIRNILDDPTAVIDSIFARRTLRTISRNFCNLRCEYKSNSGREKVIRLLIPPNQDALPRLYFLVPLPFSTYTYNFLSFLDRIVIVVRPRRSIDTILQRVRRANILLRPSGIFRKQDRRTVLERDSEHLAVIRSSFRYFYTSFYQTEGSITSWDQHCDIRRTRTYRSIHVTARRFILYTSSNMSDSQTVEPRDTTKPKPFMQRMKTMFRHFVKLCAECFEEAFDN